MLRECLMMVRKCSLMSRECSLVWRWCSLADHANDRSSLARSLAITLKDVCPNTVRYSVLNLLFMWTIYSDANKIELQQTCPVLSSYWALRCWMIHVMLNRVPYYYQYAGYLLLFRSQASLRRGNLRVSNWSCGNSHEKCTPSAHGCSDLITT